MLSKRFEHRTVSRFGQIQIVLERSLAFLHLPKFKYSQKTSQDQLPLMAVKARPLRHLPSKMAVHVDGTESSYPLPIFLTSSKRPFPRWRTEPQGEDLLLYRSLSKSLPDRMRINLQGEARFIYTCDSDVVMKGQCDPEGTYSNDPPRDRFTHLAFNVDCKAQVVKFCRALQFILHRRRQQASARLML